MDANFDRFFEELLNGPLDPVELQMAMEEAARWGEREGDDLDSPGVRAPRPWGSPRFGAGAVVEVPL